MRTVNFDERRRRICATIAQTTSLSFEEVSMLLDRYRSIDMLLCILDIADVHNKPWQVAERMVSAMLSRGTDGRYRISNEGKGLIKNIRNEPGLPVPWAELVVPSWVEGGEVIVTEADEEVAEAFLND